MTPIATVPNDYSGNETNRLTADIIQSNFHNSHRNYHKCGRPAPMIHQFILSLHRKNKAETDDVKTHAAYHASIGYGANQQDLSPEKLTVEGEVEKLYECNIVETHAQSGTNSQDGHRLICDNGLATGIKYQYRDTGIFCTDTN